MALVDTKIWPYGVIYIPMCRIRTRQFAGLRFTNLCFWSRFTTDENFKSPTIVDCEILGGGVCVDSPTKIIRHTKTQNFRQVNFRKARLACNKQRNICRSILCKYKGSYFENLDTKNLSENKKILGSVKALFWNKVSSNTHIILKEKDQMIINEYKLANIFNYFLIHAVLNLGIKFDQPCICNTSNIYDLVEKTTKKHQKHHRISGIKKYYQVSTKKLLSL